MKPKSKIRADLDLALYVSSAMLAVGVFLPLTSIPVYGDVSYHRIAQIEAYLVVIFALAAPVMLYLGQTKRLFFAPVGVWIVLLFPAIKSALTPKGGRNMFSGITDSASGMMGEFAARLFLNITEFKWGGLIFIAGLLIFTAACVLKALKR
ncbi:MAG: hypothetical protein KKG03_02390 [Gammaproteobacteria bacterium]|nr:hypothetical protein [Sideroxydans sp.]MBU3903740.1 hypothetical protein [Gammaproteobacteria bacterium]MBU4150479.1 hypothetical protein [Gammaproteobacteria bacterium]